MIRLDVRKLRYDIWILEVYVEQLVPRGNTKGFNIWCEADLVAGSTFPLYEPRSRTADKRISTKSLLSRLYSNACLNSALLLWG